MLSYTPDIIGVEMGNIAEADMNKALQKKRRQNSDSIPLAVGRLDPERSYIGIPLLLKEVIRKGDPGAWGAIKERIDYTYRYLDAILSQLEEERPFLSRIKGEIAKGKKLLFKPNLVSIENINPYTHLPLPGFTATTEWPLVAAAMRWFHDRAKVSYSQMCLGEAATLSPVLASHYTHIKGKGRPVTPEATIEGRSDDFYGGWGFYFVRRYLAETSSWQGEDPMAGLEESMAGIYLPPGKVKDKLMVYDLNIVDGTPSRGREIPVPNGQNFSSIILHKAIVGGEPSDPEERADYPGCVLINMPKLKVHNQALFTNAIKNLGIGLFPMQASRSGDGRWEYAYPYQSTPGLKSWVPHQVWVPEMDLATCLPLRGEDGAYLVKKTGGLTGTMLDILRVLVAEDIFMLHIVDAIEAVNRDHQGIGLGIAQREGLIVAGLDIVATDLFCARYLFCNIGAEEAQMSGLADRFGGPFLQAVPIPRYNGKDIITEQGYDTPLGRDTSLLQAQEAGLGRGDYYIVGTDAITGKPLGSQGGRLGYVDGGFHEIFTRFLYWDIYKMPWDLQRTFFAYLEAVDQLEGKSLKEEFLAAFDEDGDGIVSYEEFGKKGIFGPTLLLTGLYLSKRGAKDESELFRAFFAMMATGLRCSNPKWNEWGHDIGKELSYGSVAVVAYMMSQKEQESPDPFYPGLTWGKGKWPSFTLASFSYVHQVIYGWRYPSQIGVFSLYGCAVAYADHKQNNRGLIGRVRGAPDPNAAQRYVEAVRTGQIRSLDFELFVPPGYGVNGTLPNVQETADPHLIFTAHFPREGEKWPDVGLGSTE